jgi:predicted transcriptional regulator
MKDPLFLGRRTRQILEVVYARGQATVGDVLAALDNPPSRTAVRTLLRLLEQKGHLSHRQEGKEYVYRPTRARSLVGKSALRRVLHTFFQGSIERAMAAHLSDPKYKLSGEEIARLQALIDAAKSKGGGQ